ncbi:uncharacterized protein RJT21DRAFT_124896 [Scheffersomyces amazonensis]|uniref:uncharacterized protein n=1 Tax=Scheffersomyces amazonensis TaxID=1078765 RepID=UPI00315CB593
MTLEALPQELIFQISTHLNQSDLLNLLYTNSYFYNLLQARLHFAINIDSRKKIYTDFNTDDFNYVSVPNYYTEYRSMKIKPITISSLYSMNIFFKKLIQNPHLCSFIRVMIFNYEIPDISDLELFKVLTILNGKLTNLKVFKWFNGHYKLPGKFISDLNLIELEGCIQLDIPNDKLNFQYLKKLHLSNFNSGPIDFSDFPNLSELTISKLHSSSSPNYFYTGSNPSFWESKEFVSSIAQYFKRTTSIIPCLSTLTIKDMHVTGDDVKVLKSCFDTSKLTSLSILNCFESMYDQDEFYDIRRRRIKTKFFLDELNSIVNKDLKELNIYLVNELNYNNKLVNFLREFPNLQSLNLNVNLNGFENLNINLLNILKSINPDLEFLNLNYNIIGNSKNSNCFNYDSKVTNLLKNFTKLKFLNIPFHIDFKIPKKLLSNLQVLSLRIHEESISKVSQPSNCLINSEFFSNTIIVDKHSQTYIEEQICRAKYWKQMMRSLKWIQFEFDDECMMFQCDDKSNDNGQVVYREGLQNYFQQIITNQII